MGVDAGFDMVPRLSKGIVDSYNWSRFINDVKEKYKEDDKVELKPNYILFKVGEYPILPLEGHKLLRFSSKVSGSCSSAIGYIRNVVRLAKLHLGSRVLYWSESFDEYGHYDWAEVYESHKFYEQPDEPEPRTGIPPTLPSLSTIEDLEIPLFEVKEIQGKGKGLVALCDLPQGTRIIHEKPLLVTQPMAPVAFEAFLASKIRKLSKQEQRQFLSLHNNFRGKYPFGGIVKTNALPCGSGSAVGGIYATLCLINHSCLPNSQNTWNSDTKHETIYAIRPISCGEEITISYDRGGPSRDRQMFLKNSFGFHCSCSVCSLPPAELRNSDIRRLRIQRLDEQIGDPMRMAMSPRDSLQDCHSLLSSLMEEYDGHPGALTARLYYDAFQISIAHGDQARASIFAERSYKARVICEGDDTPEARKAKALAAKPSDHASFGACSSRWRSKKGMIPEGLGTEDFERWLFRMEN
jgi:hypothetical protein